MKGIGLMAAIIYKKRGTRHTLVGGYYSNNSPMPHYIDKKALHNNQTLCVEEYIPMNHGDEPI